MNSCLATAPWLAFALIGCTARWSEPVSAAGCLFEPAFAAWQTLDSYNVLIWPGPSRDGYRLRVHEGFDAIPEVPELAFIDGNRDGVICSDGWDALSLNDRTATQSPTVATVVSIASVDARAVDRLLERYASSLGERVGEAASVF